MAKSSKARAAKRIANKSNATAKTVSGPAGKADKPAKTITFNANAPKVRALISFAVAQGTTVEAAGVVGQAQRSWEAMRAGQLSPDHAASVLRAINIATHAKLKADKIVKGKARDVSGSRVSEWKKIMSLGAFNCAPQLVNVLATMDMLRVSSLYNVAQWITDNWKKELERAPTRAVLLPIVRGANKRKAKDPNRTIANAVKGGKIVGFPKSDTAKGAKFLKSAAKLFMTANPEMNANERALVTGIINNATMLGGEVAKRIRVLRVKKAAETE